VSEEQIRAQGAEPLCAFSLCADHSLLRLLSSDGTNRLTGARVLELIRVLESLPPKPLIISGNEQFFSAGADLNEVAALRSAAEAYDFALMDQRLINAVAEFPAPVAAAISGYCMGGGLDLALACRYRIATPNAMFGHRGAALGIITGWGGTQRLPRLIGKSAALKMFTTAETLDAYEALRLGLIDQIAESPLALSINLLRRSVSPW
jgi:enoyl-CoA hydratase/carnithine racemase